MVGRQTQKWRWTENRSVVLNICLHVGITWEYRKILMISYHPEWIWVSQSEDKEKRRETLPEVPGTWKNEPQLEEDRWFGVGEVQGELISARRWNFWMEGGQVFGVWLLNGLGCHCNELPFAATGKQGRIVRKGRQKIYTLEGKCQSAWGLWLGREDAIARRYCPGAGE